MSVGYSTGHCVLDGHSTEWSVHVYWCTDVPGPGPGNWAAGLVPAGEGRVQGVYRTLAKAMEGSPSRAGWGRGRMGTEQARAGSAVVPMSHGHAGVRARSARTRSSNHGSSSTHSTSLEALATTSDAQTARLIGDPAGGRCGSLKKIHRERDEKKSNPQPSGLESDALQLRHRTAID